MGHPFSLTQYDVHYWLASGLIDDSTRKVADAAGLAAKRAEVVAWLWGTNGFPSAVPAVTSDVDVAWLGLSNLARADRLDLATIAHKIGGTEITVNTVAYHYVPASGGTGKCLLVCHGHGHYAQGSGGLINVMQAALTAGHGVVALHMTCHYTPVNGSTEVPWCDPRVGDSHGWLQNNVPYSATEGAPQRLGYDLPIACINLLSGEYTEFAITGLSGGGWTASVVGALDTRIAATYPIAGTQPLYMRTDGSTGDIEQTLAYYYEMAGWLDHYNMSANGRRLAFIFNHLDSCCFGPLQYSDTGAGARIVGLTYEEALDDMVAECNSVVGAGSVAWVLDATDTGHMCTAWAAAWIIADWGSL
jgi:hypothetical protein